MDGTLQGEQSYSGRALDKAYTFVGGGPGLLRTFSINTVNDLPRVNSSQTSTPNDHLSTTHTGTHTLELQSYVADAGYMLHSSRLLIIMIIITSLHVATQYAPAPPVHSPARLAAMNVHDRQAMIMVSSI